MRCLDAISPVSSDIVTTRCCVCFSFFAPSCVKCFNGMRSLIHLCLFHSMVYLSVEWRNIPSFTPDYAKNILEFAKKYRYKVEWKHGIKLFRTNETLNVSSEYDSGGEEYFMCEVNSSYELDEKDLSTAMSWMDDKTTPNSVEKMTLNISDYHFNIDKQFAHQVDYDFNDSFPVASQPYSDDGIQEPIARNYFVKRNESYYLKDITELFSSYERQFLPTIPDDLRGTFVKPRTTTRNFSKQHASNPYKRLFRCINTELFTPYLSVGSDEVTRIDFPTTLTQYREPFFVYVHRLSDTNTTFYHNRRKYYYRSGTLIRDLNGLKYFVPNVTFPTRQTRQTKRTKYTRRKTTTRRKANVRSKLKSAKTTTRKAKTMTQSVQTTTQRELHCTKTTIDTKLFEKGRENVKIWGLREDDENLEHWTQTTTQRELHCTKPTITFDPKVFEKGRENVIWGMREDDDKLRHWRQNVYKKVTEKHKDSFCNDTIHKFLLDKLSSLQALLTTTTEPTTKRTSYVQQLFTLPTNRWAPIQILKPDHNVVTFRIAVKKNFTHLYIVDKRSVDPNYLHSSVIFANSIRRNKEWEAQFEHLNMNLFGRHRNHKKFTTTPTPRTRRTRVSKPSTTSKTTALYIYESCLTLEIV